MYCLHHDEAELFGSDPVPCPFCGLGTGSAGEKTSGEPMTAAVPFQDSQDALRHALTLSKDADPARSPRRSRTRRAYW